MPIVTGHIHNPAGHPAAAVPVAAWDTCTPAQRVATHTDRAGRWRLTLPRGRWTVRPLGHAGWTVDVGDHDIDVTDDPVAASTVAGTTGPGSVSASVPSPATLAAALARRRRHTRSGGGA